jgi:predicted O-methyltransferase YrrM
MSQELWTAVEEYLTQTLVQPDAALTAALADSAAAGLPNIAVSPVMGKWLHLLARIRGARSILEIGTLGGYSTIWLARALPPGGRLVTLESEPAHAAIAQANLARAGVADRVEIRLGPALVTLPQLTGPFDLIFIDADKPAIPDYFQQAMRLSKPGTVIVVDNVVRNGAVVDAASTDDNVQGVRRFHEMVAADRRVSATALATTSSKGYDGFTVVFVQDGASS